jgi:hypothetical protein
VFIGLRAYLICERLRDDVDASVLLLACMLELKGKPSQSFLSL